MWVFSGGFGTLDEFAEIITLVQTEKIPSLPIVLCGKSFWRGLLAWFNQLKKYRYISPQDTKIFTIMEYPTEIADYLTSEIL
jgi:predicted Rossmann-fold nucleotide-binding protein